MLAIIGTVPEEDFPITSDRVHLDGNYLILNNRKIPINRGTPALIASACKIFEILGKDMPYVYLVGDTGKGYGSKKLYEYFAQDVKKIKLLTHLHFTTSCLMLIGVIRFFFLLMS